MQRVRGHSESALPQPNDMCWQFAIASTLWWHWPYLSTTQPSWHAPWLRICQVLHPFHEAPSLSLPQQGPPNPAHRSRACVLLVWTAVLVSESSHCSWLALLLHTLPLLLPASVALGQPTPIACCPAAAPGDCNHNHMHAHKASSESKLGALELFEVQ